MTQSETTSSFRGVAVVIVNWNGLMFLPACLLSLSRQTYPNVEIVVVDNASTDGSVAYLEQHHPHVQIIRNTRNVGFAAACNQGIQATSTEFIALLNNDAVAHPQWLAAMVEMMADPVVGMCACRMLSMHDADVIDSAGIAVDRLGYAWGIGGGLQDRPENYPAPHQVFGPSGGAGLYRRRMLDDIGLFDEDFFAYLEDVDLAWRGQWAGWQCRFVANAIVFHVHSATTARIPHLKGWLLARNRIWMIAKNYPARFLAAYLLLLILSEAGALIYLAHHGRLRSSLRGRLEAVRHIPKMLNKRRQTLRRITDRQMMVRLQPVELPDKLLRRYQFVAHKQS
ncbi:MAG: glycosyltransferase family 2 protein [Caldilinea sp.]